MSEIVNETLPEQKIVLVGGGGFGREVLGYLQADIATGALANCQIAGVVDDDPKCEVMRGVSFLGRLDALEMAGQYRFLIAIGSSERRQKVASEIAALGYELFTYVHSSVYIAQGVIVGSGTVVGPNCIINLGAVVGKCCALNVFCSVGHDAIIGDFSVLSPYCALNGNSRIGNSCMLGTRATIFPGVRIGDHCKVDTHSFVKRDVADSMIVSNRCRYLAIKNRLGG